MPTGVLVEAADFADEGPHPLRPDSGEIVGLRKTSRGWFAVSQDEEAYFDPIPIEEDDARQFHISLLAFVDSLRRQNAIVGSDAVGDGKLISIGQKTLDGYGTVDVYLAIENTDTQEFIARCRAVQRPHGIKQVVILTPCAIPLANTQRELLDARGVSVVSLAPASTLGKLAIDWDEQVIGPTEGRTGDGVYPPHSLVLRGREYRCELTRRESAFMALALRADEIPLGTLIHRGQDALWQETFRNNQVTRDKVAQFLSRLNKKLAATTPPFPVIFALPRNITSIRRMAESNAVLG